MRSFLPAQRQAAGARAAWSKPSNSPPKRPRCSGDAGAMGSHRVPSSQKAGDAGNRRGSLRDSVRDCGRQLRRRQRQRAAVSVRCGLLTRCSRTSCRSRDVADVKGQERMHRPRRRPLTSAISAAGGGGMNNQEVIMRNALPSTGLIAHHKALEAAGMRNRSRLTGAGSSEESRRSGDSFRFVGARQSLRRSRPIRPPPHAPLAHRLRLSERGRHPPASPR